MNVLLLSATPGIPLMGPSGASAHLRADARALRKLGFDVHVAVPLLQDHRGPVEDRVEAAVTIFPPRRWTWLRGYREWGEILDGRKLVERVLGTGFEPDFIYERHSLFCDAGMRMGIPRIVELNAPLAMERQRFARVFNPAMARKMEGALLRSADRVVAVSRWLSRWAVREVGCEPQRVLHVPNGAASTRVVASGTLRRRLGLRGLVLGFMGTMKPWHGVDRLPGILDLLPEAMALVVGDGPCPVPPHPRLVSVGRVKPSLVGEYVAAMDVGLVLYRRDAPPWFCPLKLLEYMAQGVPVVAADVGDCGFLLARGGGELVSSDEPARWAAAIRRQAESRVPARRRSFTQVMREALDGFSVEGTTLDLPMPSG